MLMPLAPDGEITGSAAPEQPRTCTSRRLGLRPFGVDRLRAVHLAWQDPSPWPVPTTEPTVRGIPMHQPAVVACNGLKTVTTTTCGPRTSTFREHRRIGDAPVDTHVSDLPSDRLARLHVDGLLRRRLRDGQVSAHARVPGRGSRPATARPDPGDARRLELEHAELPAVHRTGDHRRHQARSPRARW